MIRRKSTMNYSHISPDMTPMIDMVFILLIFVLVAASFVKVAEMEVNLPASSHTPALSGKPLVVEITTQGAYKIDEQAHGLQEVVRKLGQIHDRQILVAADKNSHTQHLIEFLDQCKAANITNLKVAVIRGG